MQLPLYIGADVAKETLVVACAAHTFAPQTLTNRAPALKAWLKTLPAGSLLGVEATGGYHELLADLAVAAGVTVLVLNPKDVCHYAKACGARAKTDRVDAALIARYVAHEHRQLHPLLPAYPDAAPHPATVETPRQTGGAERGAHVESKGGARRGD